MMSSQNEVLARIDAIIAASDPASEPLVQALTNGTLTRDDLRTFAGQYFHLIDALPRFVSTVHSVTGNSAWRKSLLNVLVALEHKTPTASDLWLQTCAALGLFSDTVKSSDPNVATATCLSDYEYLCQSGSAQGFAALYAWMSRLPLVCRALQVALGKHYSITSGPGVEFFEIIGFQAQNHVRSLRAGLMEILDTYPEASDAAEHAAQSAIIAVKAMYLGALNTQAR